MIPFKKILCPTDFSEPSYNAMEAAKELALHFSAELFVVHVIPTFPAVTGPPETATYQATYQQELEASSKKMLHEVLELKVPKELNVHPIIIQGDAAYKIVQITEEERIDLIVIATHGRTGWRRFIFGSVAERVVRLATCAVLTIQAPHEEEKGE